MFGIHSPRMEMASRRSCLDGTYRNVQYWHVSELIPTGPSTPCVDLATCSIIYAVISMSISVGILSYLQNVSTDGGPGVGCLDARTPYTLFPFFPYVSIISISPPLLQLVPQLTACHNFLWSIMWTNTFHTCSSISRRWNVGCF